MPCITTRTIRSVRPESTPFFIRDTKLQGFAVKVNPSGSIKYVVEVWSNGKSHRRTVGDYPTLGLSDARKKAIALIDIIFRENCSDVDSDSEALTVTEPTLEDLFNNYVTGRELKERTVKTYSEAVFFYLKDWLDKPISHISKQMVEMRYYQIRDKGVFGGGPTYSQASSAMRILSALMNYALADELVEQNPVSVLKLKRLPCTTRVRNHYLRVGEVRELLTLMKGDRHPVVLAVQLILYTGLRKNEALTLKWNDLRDVDGVKCIVLGDTKNGKPHYVPVTVAIQSVLDKAQNKTEFIFPSTANKNRPAIDERATLKRLSNALGIHFRCHDLRRTFATRATEVGIDYLMVKRLLNHKSNDITAQYIQWDSKANLLVAKKALESVRY